VLQKRSKENKRITRRKSLVCDHYLFIYHGTGLCLLLEWCGGAVLNFQAREIERALVLVLLAALGPYLV
jgi:hypothetical protein